MAHETDAPDVFAEGFSAGLAFIGSQLKEARHRLEAELKEKGIEHAEQPTPRVNEDPGGGTTYCVVLRFNPYFSAYCVDVNSGYAWYVPR